MERKINIAELLKDCPQGMELNCVINENVYFDKVLDDVDSIYPIRCYILEYGVKSLFYFTQYGEFINRETAKCVIFPKGKTSWEGFQRPFKDGDIVFYNNTIAIFKEWGDPTLFRTYCVFYITVSNPIYQFEISRPLFGKGIRNEVRLATEEEKQKLFDAIKDNGYKWNEETKILEKLVEPRFKIGDRIKHKNGKDKNGVEQGLILSITDDTYDVAITNDMGIFVPIADQDEWELISNKFDINTLKPFDKVLVRTEPYSKKWVIAFYSHYINDRHYVCGGLWYKQCIPYEGNEYLHGTTNNCSEYYKTW